MITAVTLIIAWFGTLTFFYLIFWFFPKLAEMDSELRIGTSGSNWGEIRLDKFAVRCGIHASIARWYLDSKVRQLNGLKETDELGDVTYLFGEAKRKFLQEHLALLEQPTNRTS